VSHAPYFRSLLAAGLLAITASDDRQIRVTFSQIAWPDGNSTKFTLDYRLGQTFVFEAIRE